MKTVLTCALVVAGSCLLLSASLFYVLDKTGKIGDAYNVLFVIVKAMSVCVGLIMLTLLAIRTINNDFGIIQYGLTVVVSFMIAVVLRISQKNM